MTKNYKIELPPSPIRESVVVRLGRRLRRLGRKSLPSDAATGWPSMPYPTVELVYWRPADGVNFGDELSRTIVELMLAKRGKTIFDEVASPRRLLAIGSVLHYAQDNSVIWGSGLNGSVFESSHSYRSLDVRSVRGPITRAFLKKRGVEAPEVYGDPGLLIKVLTGDRFGRQKSSKVGVVPHFSDLSRPDIMRLKGSENVLVIDPYRSWNTVVDQIASCDFVVSSSLHGLVVADAFEIPSIYVRLSEREGVLKYEDYYAGTDRELSFASTIDEAMAHQGAKKLRYDTAKLMAVFPYDIWLSGFVP